MTQRNWPRWHKITNRWLPRALAPLPTAGARSLSLALLLLLLLLRGVLRWVLHCGRALLLLRRVLVVLLLVRSPLRARTAPPAACCLLACLELSPLLLGDRRLLRRG